MVWSARTWLALAICGLAGLSCRAASADFDRTIAPLLVRRCLDCHAGPKPKGGLDLSRSKSIRDLVVAGKPDQSTLWQRVRDGEMPPKKALPPAERKLLQEWIAGGARWGSDPIDPFRFTTEHRAGYDWWALQPLAKSPPPAIRKTVWVRNPIDAHVLARLEKAGLEPAPEADRRTLIRRLSFDLVGLPPAPEEIEAFVHDGKPDAVERLVDRLLGSPHYGERWARHWLDIVRFGESNGFERDLPRLTAWPYRDWVVTAFNRDLPYDEFARMQLAGDLLRPSDPEALKATGFLVAGPHDTVEPVVQRMRDAMRQDEMEDLVGTVGQTFLGLTVNCARCHDHKFDPVAQNDYYRLAAALDGVRHGERDLKPAGSAAELARVQARLDAIARQMDAIDSPARRRILAERNGQKPAVSLPRPLAEWDFGIGTGPELALRGGARRDKEGLALDGKDSYARSGPFPVALREKTLEAWVRLGNLQQQGGGVLTVQTHDGVVFDAIVFGEREPGRWMAGSDGFTRTQTFSGLTEATAAKDFVHVAIVYHPDGTIAGYRNGRPYGAHYRSQGPMEFKAGEYRVVFGCRHELPGGNRMLTGTIARARLYDTVLSSAQVAASAGTGVVSEADVLASLGQEQRRQREQLVAEAGRLRPEAARLELSSFGRVYAMTPAPPAPTHVLIRGETGALGPLVSPGGIAALPGGAGFGLKPDASERDRRLKLAQWITAGDNPLFARVVVNRLWHYHFGAGLVETPSDFGFNGGRPSHPELLDYLAGELQRQRWGLKALHRTMVLSAAYRQAVVSNPAAAKIDAGNRLLWRRSPQRLEAEAVRDAILAVSGTLDRTVGGRGYHDFRTYFFKGTQFYDPIQQIGPTFARRTLYRMWARGGRSPFLDTFDCPDPSATSPKRATTTTPLQALALLNNAFVLDQADRLAERLRNEAGDNLDRQLTRAYVLAYCRAPEAPELATVRPFVNKHGLAAFCRVLFNSNEFLLVE